jgi:RNA polymerase sigma factor (sigma-70 family)
MTTVPTPAMPAPALPAVDTLDELAERAKRGDRGALEDLLAALEPRLFRLAYRFLHHRQDAADATQEILILVLTKLSTFRGDSSVATWAYRVACRHLLRAREKSAQAAGRQVSFEALVEHDLAQPPNAIAPAILARADARLLEEEVFLGCTQAMLAALDRPSRIAFVLGAICELDSNEAAYILDIGEAAFRKRLSRARATLDSFVDRHCGVANPANPCRCAYQVNHGVRLGRLDPACLRYAAPSARTSLDTLRAFDELGQVRSALQLYRSQPDPQPPDELSARLRALLDAPGTRLFEA